jgi:hypothetical protein
MIKTICDHCYFAESKNGEQTGCSLGRLEIYKDIGVAEKKENGFYEISKLCVCCRTADAVKDYDDPAEEVLKQAEPKITVIVNCLDGFDDEVVQSIVNEKPYEVICYFYKDKISTVNKKLAEIVKGTGVKYRIVNFMEDDPTHVNVIKYINGNYVFVGKPSGNLQGFKEELVYQLKNYLLFGNKDSFIVSTLLYKHVGQEFSTLKNYILEKEDGEQFLCEM